MLDLDNLNLDYMSLETRNGKRCRTSYTTVDELTDEQIIQPVSTVIDTCFAGFEVSKNDRINPDELYIDEYGNQYLPVDEISYGSTAKVVCNFTDEPSYVMWETSNPEIAYVSADGYIVPVNDGDVDIICTAINGDNVGESKSFQITIYNTIHQAKITTLQNP